MNTRVSRPMGLALAGALLAMPAAAQNGTPTPQPFTPVAQNVPTGPHGYIRCLTPSIDLAFARALPASDCTANSTNPAAQYSPENLDEVEIQVVFHVIRQSNGNGDVPNSRVNSQIDILNEDFGALAGTPGAPGVDTKIRFTLATVDPNGQPTTGIERYNNSTWYQDSGSYFNSIAWDPDVYLNIYTMGSPGGSSNTLGYVPFLPQTGGGSVGANSDRVVILNTAVGRNAPISTYNQGRTTVHEVGHYLGLYHTFQSGCSSGNCNTSGDRICDTNSESQPEYNCPSNSSSCGSSDPVRNYMNYSPDSCMSNFTEQQARRMRCTLEFYRPQLAQPIGPELGENYCFAATNSTGQVGTLFASGTKFIANNDFVLNAVSVPSNTFGLFVVSDTQSFVPTVPNSQGFLCVGANTGRYNTQLGNSGPFGIIPLIVDVTAVPSPNGPVATLPGQTWNFQCWYRDSNPTPTSNFTDGYTITFQ